jgi:HK97 family phage major capsid protein
MLDEAMKWFGGADACGSFETDTGNPMPYPTINDTTNKGRIIGQNTQVIETDLIFAETTFNAYIGSSDLVLLPLALAEDSYFDMDALVARLLGIRLGRLKNNMCTVGTGVNQPTGIVTAAAAAGLTYTMATGATAGPSYADLVGVEHSIDNAYRQNADGTPRATWMFNDLTLKGIKKLLDSSGRPLWQSGLTTSMAGGEAVLGTGRPNILGYPYVINDDILPPTANAQSLIFGDLSKFIVRKLKSGTTVLVLRERYADYLQLGFIAFQRFDSNLIDAGTHPICVASNSST